MIQPVPRAGSGVAAEDAAHAAVIRRYEERLVKDPSSLAFAPLADAYRKAGRTQDAIRLCEEGLARFPHYATARLILAKALLDEGQGERAQAELEAIAAAGARDAEAHRLLGEIHRKAGRLEAALEQLEQAARLDPADRESRLAAEMLGGRGRAPEGSPLAAILGDDTFATESFGAVCLEQGLVDEAAQVLLRVLQKEPGAAGARERLEQAIRLKMQRRKGP
jgi:tetratricopeptide (TPR) repeat protein